MTLDLLLPLSLVPGGGAAEGGAGGAKVISRVDVTPVTVTPADANADANAGESLVMSVVRTDIIAFTCKSGGCKLSNCGNAFSLSLLLVSLFPPFSLGLYREDHQLQTSSLVSSRERETVMTRNCQ